MQGRLLYSPMRNSCAARTAVFSVTAHICCVSGHGLRNHPARVSLGGDLGGNAQEEIAYVSANGTRRAVLCRYIAALRRRRRPCCCKSCLNMPRKCHAARMGHARSSSTCRKKAGCGRKLEGSSERNGAIAARAALALTNSPDAPTNSRAGSAYFPSLILTLSPIFLPPFSFCLHSLGYNADIKPE